jgi:hypothetical protein
MRFPIAKLSLLGGVLLGATTSLLAQTTIPLEAQQAAKSVRPAAIKASMQSLADDKMEGRYPGTRGFELAATYVQSQLQALGLQPAGEKGTYRQAVPLRRWQVRPATSSLMITQNGTERQLVYGKTFFLNPNPDQASADVRAQVVFVGYGVSAPELGYDDFAGVDVKGKIVACFNGAPASFPSNQRAYYRSAKAEMAAAHGAVGVVSFDEPTDLLTRFEPAALRAQKGLYRWVDKQGKPQRTFPAIQGSATLSDSVARGLFAGAPVSFAVAVTNAQKNRPQAFPLKVSVRIQTQTVVAEDVAGQNVVALWPGADPALKDEYVVYVAHIDHLGIGRPVKGDSIYNGAHDNASGVAINLETARLFASLPKAPRRSILFVGVTGEEMGLLGSDFFATNPTVPKEKIVANLSLDMPFFFHPLRDIVPYGTEHSSLAQQVNTAATFLKIAIAKDPIPEQAVFLRSDHFSFVRQGIPSLFIKSGSQTGDPKVDGTKLNLDWRATIYHTPQDDMNQPFNFDAAAQHAQLQFLIGYLVAQAQERPTWNKGDFFGRKFGTPTPVK